MKVKENKKSSNQSLLSVPISVFSIQKFNDTMSKGRCRLFYKGRNRNGGYISDKFAEQLLATIPYTPVKGIYSEEEEDFEGHGTRRDEGRIYGIVPENPNITWNEHLDDDGKIRDYAECDVLIYTALYKEAAEIFKKGQSLEIYLPTLKGEWKFIDGIYSYYYTGGSFLSLQILGEAVEPCFEGASFFSLDQTMEAIQNYSLMLDKMNQGGQEKMKIKSKNAKVLEQLFSKHNPNFSAENDWVVENGIFQLNDSLYLNSYENDSLSRIKMTKKEGVEEVEDQNIFDLYDFEVEETPMTAIPVAEKEELENDKATSATTIEEINNKLNTLQEENEGLKKQISDLETKKVESETTISTLTQDRDTAIEEKNRLDGEVSSLNTELNTLKEYKLNIETKEKEELLSTYEEKLSKDIIEKFQNEMANYSYEGLEKELAFSLVKNTPNLFSHEEKGYIPKDSEKSGIEKILSRYN